MPLGGANWPGRRAVSTLWKVYGPSFAQGAKPNEKLSDLLAKMDKPSLTELVHAHEHGNLEQKNAETEVVQSSQSAFLSIPTIDTFRAILPRT